MCSCPSSPMCWISRLIFCKIWKTIISRFFSASIEHPNRTNTWHQQGTFLQWCLQHTTSMGWKSWSNMYPSDHQGQSGVTTGLKPRASLRTPMRYRNMSLIPARKIRAWHGMETHVASATNCHLLPLGWSGELGNMAGLHARPPGTPHRSGIHMSSSRLPQTSPNCTTKEPRVFTSNLNIKRE
jgi:hypothetical protein